MRIITSREDQNKDAAMARNLEKCIVLLLATVVRIIVTNIAFKDIFSVPFMSSLQSPPIVTPALMLPKQSVHPYTLISNYASKCTLYIYTSSDIYLALCDL